jgi:O-methyltransferase
MNYRSAGSRPPLIGALNKFTINSRHWFERTMRFNGISRVAAQAAAIQDFNFTAETQFCFVLLDVDLYLPTKTALEKLWPRLSPGGIIVIDDCQPEHVYDGSRQALQEFSAAHGLVFEVLETKLGVLRRPR